ncbi:alpha/beta hydrolase [Ktedonosporobacter rubrisoli]|uniref:Alpha/beta hydrolase n=1 Tax=Ktedonosporobacter rubrisoli TaxID=2509675 RepID=A0A4V0YY55_KTERU|nr:alpha/beta hydrolase [Ktedonosporobacter rubrisoli]QBD75041.1 alpha/beta hydrolase [Ktedonosporobacter rubrisoli]
MPIDPQVQAMLDQMAALGFPPLETLPVKDVRSLIPTPASGRVLGGIEDRQITGPAGKLWLRLYTPEGKGPFPILVFAHGGGWVYGSIESHDALCRELTHAANCITISVGYRLAPEHPYPAALEDCYAATCWAIEHASSFNGDPARVAVGGDSAGGNLATVVALMARDHNGPPLVYQLLLYPITDHYSRSKPSYEENGEGYMVTKKHLIWCWDHYISSGEEAKQPYVSPLQAQDLSGLPPALVITAEYDPLRDEGECYAKRLQEAGVPVALKRHNGMIHGFVDMYGVLDSGKQALADLAAGLRAAFGRA